MPDEVVKTTSEPADGTVNIPSEAAPDVMKDAMDRPSDVRAKVDGRDMIVPGTEVAALVQKGLAADKRFEEAATMKKGAEDAIRNWEDVKALLEGGDEDAFRRVGIAVGMPTEQVEAALQLVTDGEEAQAASTPKPAAPTEEQGEIPFHRLPTDLQEIVIRQEKERITGIIKNSLDNDPEIGYNMKLKNDPQREAVLRMVMEKVSGRLRSTNSRFGDGSQVMQQILPDVKEILGSTGSHTRDTGQVGIGPSPGGERSSVHPLKEPDHVSSTDPGFEQSILDTLVYNQQKANDGGL